MLRARALEAAGRVDEAARDLEIAVNLAPSNALAWRTLGKILAQHGGALEAERADEALRNALTLEPGWTDLRELRDKLARRRADGKHAARARARATVPSEIARGLYQQAEEWIRVGDPVGLGRELLDQALADSPGFVAAAVSSYALTGKLPPATLEALKNDGPALWALASGVRKLGQTGKKAATSDDVEALVRPLIDRAVALDVQEARFARAIARAATGDRAGAVADLTAYVAREPNPEHLAEARALRAEIEDRASPRGDSQPSPELLARIRLLEDKPEWRAARARRPVRARGPGRSSRRAGPGQRVRRSAGGGARLLRDGRGDRRHAGRRGARARGEPRRAAARRGAAQGRSPHARRGGGRAHRRRRVGAGPARGGRGRSDRPRSARTERALALAVGNTTDGDQWVDGGARRATGVSPTACARTKTRAATGGA